MIGSCVIWSITVNKRVAAIISTDGFLPIPTQLCKICITFVHYRWVFHWVSKELISVNSGASRGAHARFWLFSGCVGAKVGKSFELRSSVVIGRLCRSPTRSHCPAVARGVCGLSRRRIWNSFYHRSAGHAET